MKTLHAFAVAAGPRAGRGSRGRAGRLRKYGADPNYKVPRLPDGQPDLQGVWGNNSVTPMTRPRQWKDKTVITDAELNELKQLAAQVGRSGRRRDLRQLHPADSRREGEGRATSRPRTIRRPATTTSSGWPIASGITRTSLIIDPPDGQFPALTPEAQARRAAAARRPRTRGPADGPEDRPLSERCISYGAPRTQPNYNSYTQIIQSPETVVLLQEMIHDARVVPMTDKPHLPKKIRQLHGDPRGRWEGDTLVVETTNYINGSRARRRM